MIFLKQANIEDIDKEFEAIKKIPENENGFENKYFNCTYEDFKTNIINTLISNSKGIGLIEGYVPCTWYFMWNDFDIVGLFKLRHYLTDSLKDGSGHIGYCVLKEHRGKSYATEGLKQMIEICKDIIPENEICLRVRNYNTPSLKVMLKNGAKIVKETDDHIYTRIKIK